MNTPGKQIDVELFFAHSPVDAANATTTFANNLIAATETNVFARKMVNLPTVPTNDWAVAPFMLDIPFVWILTHFSWRAIVWGNSNGNAIFNYPLDAWNITGNTGSSRAIGAGCKHTNGSSVATLSATISTPGTSCTFTGNAGIQVIRPTFLTLGASLTSWGSLTLPFSLASLNAPGCAIYNDVLAALSGTTNSTGVVTHIVPLPGSPSLEGQVFYAQAVFLDPAANGLGSFMSNGSMNTIASQGGITRIYATGNPTATSGALGVNYGMAVGFN